MGLVPPLTFEEARACVLATARGSAREPAWLQAVLRDGCSTVRVMVPPPRSGPRAARANKRDPIAALSPDGGLLANSGEIVTVRNARDLTTLHTIHPPAPASALAFSRDGF